MGITQEPLPNFLITLPCSIFTACKVILKLSLSSLIVSDVVMFFSKKIENGLFSLFYMQRFPHIFLKDF